jgi:transposase
MTDLKLLAPGEKKVVAKELVNAGYSCRTIEDLIGADYSTISLWAKQETPEELQQFSTQFKSELAKYKNKGLAMVHRRILELVPKERRIDQVVKAGEYLEGKSGDSDNPNLKKRIVAEEFFQ